MLCEPRTGGELGRSTVGPHHERAARDGQGRPLDRRAAGMASLAERLAEQGHLRPGVSVERAANLLWILTSFDAYDLLATGRALSADDAAGLLIETAERTLFA